ncbi:unnamed protein product [Bubo scandiacus]
MSAEWEIRQLQKAKEKAQCSGNLVEEAEVCNQLGESLASHGRYEEALEEHRQELHYEAALKHQRQHLELAQSLSDDTEQQRAWATLGRTYMLMADSRLPQEGAAVLALQEAERAFCTSLAIVEEKLEGSVAQREITEMRSRLYLNLGLVYDSLKEPAKRDHYIKKSIFLSEQGRLYENLYHAYFNLGHIQLREGEHSVAFVLPGPGTRLRPENEREGDGERVLRQHGPGPAEFGGFCGHQALAEASLSTKVTRLQEALEEAAASDLPVALALCRQLGDTFSNQARRLRPGHGLLPKAGKWG